MHFRYEELEKARPKLAAQPPSSRPHNSVNELIHGNLDLDRTLATIARALVDEAGFERAEVDVEATVDGVEVARVVRQGQSSQSALVRVLMGRESQRIGELRVYPSRETNRAQAEELLDFVEPTISMALVNAISYLVVEQYRRGLEKRVDERTQELSQARDELAATVLHLEEAREVRERIFANVNHELRTPLSLILLAVSDARARHNGGVDAELARSFSTIEDAARRLLRMVDDLLLLAEGREGEIKLWLAPCDL